ncbi:hypothetical protein FDA94_09230 [Herbidospora galbida]|uniref:Uncharacterized protein n=1 Tax=Herbidospora galbida TaxID=2575442 RepID=A0A4U3MLQ0_9ACTN|nr:hypothetical protein [Herbidospora galbida]TKK89562.1 hypothetical protein FDA94_09230 [Herbidospora galbida]
MAERLIRTSYVDPTVTPPEPRQGDTGLHESRQDQEGYHDPLHRMHGADLHGWGVASGLTVAGVSGDSGLLVSPGVALDRRGRLLPLAPGGRARLGHDAQALVVSVGATGVTLPTAGVTGLRLVTISWGEAFDFTGVAAGVFNTETTPVLRLRETAAFADDGEEVVLALVEIDNDDAGSVLTVMAGRRRTTRISLDRLLFQHPGAGTEKAFHEPGAELRAGPGGVLDVIAPLLRVGRGPETPPVLMVDPVSGRLGVTGAASFVAPVAFGHSDPLGVVHAVGAGGFETEDAGGVLKSSATPLLGRALTDGQTTIGAVNSNGRPAFALSIDHDQGTPTARGIPAFWDKFDGVWHLAFSIKNGDLAVGHRAPRARLHVVGAPREGDMAVRVESPAGIGIWSSCQSSGIALIAESRPTAAVFHGDVFVNGKLSKSLLNFRIDHPLDPAARYLNHSAVESDEIKNVYDGEVILGDEGTAEIVLPDWFEALNERFRYQLTPIGRPCPNLHVAREISANTFAVAGGEPGAKVCWQVTGVRHDPYARANPLVVESDKEGAEHGRYLHPEPHGAAPDLDMRLHRGVS